MHLETDNRKAFEFVTEALRDIGDYKRSKNFERLKAAQAKLEGAVREDPDYVRPRYYLGILYDMAGRPKDAESLLEALRGETLPFGDELHYSLGLAYYHQYSWPKLDKAIEHFSKLVAATKNQALRLLGKANLAQAYAMHMIPPAPDNLEITSIRSYYRKVQELCNEVSDDIARARGRPTREINDENLKEAEWSMHNARGMSIMYLTDYDLDRDEKVRMLEEALRELTLARTITGENWANDSDLGSCHARISYYTHRAEDFHKSIEYLERVIEKLRPGYGFALYEVGRVYRIHAEFQKALQYFRRSLDVPADYRDVSNTRVEREIHLALIKETTYP